MAGSLDYPLIHCPVTSMTVTPLPSTAAWPRASFTALPVRSWCWKSWIRRPQPEAVDHPAYRIRS